MLYNFGANPAAIPLQELQHCQPTNSNKSQGDIMSTYEVISLMINFAILIILVINTKK